jgi:hypothetical protein
MTLFPTATLARMVTAAAAAVVVATTVAASQAPASADLKLPQNATALEGLPHVRLDATQDRARRRILSPAEAARNKLVIKVDNGQFYWAGAGQQPLAVTSAEGFTYLSSSQPGRYVRFRHVNDTLTYVEHVDMASGSVTYWGELRVIVGR